MYQITYVSPFSISADNNHDLISLLKDYNLAEIPESVTTKIPVAGTVDISSIVSQNDRKIPTGFNDPSTKNDLDAAIIEDNIEEDEEPQHFVELATLEPKNRQQQLCTVLLQGFPALKRPAIEKVLKLLLLTQPASISNSFVWTVIVSDHDQSDRKNVFLRFSSVEMKEWFQQNWKHLKSVLPSVSSVFTDDEENVEKAVEKNLDNKVEKMEVDSGVLKKVTAEVSHILANSKNFGRGSRTTGTEDLDEVMQYYRTYKVENSELVEVPKDIKEKIVKDIIKFRSKVLTIEKDRRKKEIERERRKAKARLTQIFQGIKEAAVTETAPEPMEIEEDAEEKLDHMEPMTEAEYEKHLVEKEAKELEEAYAKRVQKVEHQERTEKARLVDQLTTATNYEENLIENKFTSMEDIKSFQDFNVDRINAGLSSKLQLYYNNHLEYLRIRNNERTREELRDTLDAEEEAKQSGEKFTYTVPQVEKAETVISNLPESPDVEMNIVVADLPETKLRSVREKISELVEEFLGIKETVLIDFIYDFVLEKNLGLKEELVTELQETLDEDSQIVVDKLHLHVRSL